MAKGFDSFLNFYASYISGLSHIDLIVFIMLTKIIHSENTHFKIFSTLLLLQPLGPNVFFSTLF